MTLVLHISNLVSSSFTIGGQNSTTIDTSSSQTIKGLIDQQKELEYQVANTLNP
ncbi:hypothetical protein LZF95_07005 [Algoriphagus sp. AGSA1]|uniref:hypothetical protein n=1 Tax=Algoriphagus sp. AGSA1 TaxID=2907213 RepID=UPI001F2D9510|nr:hypothetical protein [Algoriphagus sp. AGSA1]MCE7054414.1 hypothetical protein [Algoriphagus sp. AGSA1]